jgi:hypothetical protein
MIAALLLFALQAEALPVVRTEVSPGVKPAPSVEKGTLIGCFFPAKGSTEKHPSFGGLAIYLPPDQPQGPLAASLISDKQGLLGGGTLERLDWRGGTMRFTSLHPRSLALTLQSTGGDLFEAKLDGARAEAWKQTGTCQSGKFSSREAAFTFYDGLIREMNESGRPYK